VLFDPVAPEDALGVVDGGAVDEGDVGGDE
jgi:hypothetical protein